MKRTQTLVSFFLLSLLSSIIFATQIPNLFQSTEDPLINASSQEVHHKLMDFYLGKKVLVTGGAGFIGSHIVEKLVELKAKVTVLDNLSTGNKDNLAHIINHIEFIHGDIRDTECVKQATQDKDIVFHLAAFISVPQSVENPKLCNEINIDGTRNILEFSSKNNVKTFILSSSCAVYGNKNNICNEDDIPHPESPYAASKLAGEQLCKQYAQDHLISTVCLRYFNVYGNRQNPQGQYAAVVAKFAHNLQNNLPITIFGDGQQTRDFIHVSHVALANLVMGMQTSCKGDIFNIGSGKTLSIIELVRHLEIGLNTHAIKINFEPARLGDILHSQANNQKYISLIDSINKAATH